MNRSAATQWSSLVVVLSGLMGCHASSSSSTSASPEAAGSNCATGGVVVRSGVDADGNGVVSESEAVSTTYVCNGASGPVGTTGTVSLNKVTAEPQGSHCTRGGFRLDTGLDANGNNTLDAAEIASTEYLCTPEPAAGGLLLLSKTYVNSADAACPGGYVRIAYGIDADGNGMLSATEQSSTFLACNAMPRLTSPSTVTVADCTATPIVLPITPVDLDGRVVQIDVQVLGSGSPVSFSTTASGEIRLTAGAHVAGADLEVTLTDDVGSVSVTQVRVMFSGTGCVPLTHFYGVKPTTCEAVEIDPLAGDDRSGPVLTQRGAYYNGDKALIRVGLDLSGATTVVSNRVDGLMGDAVQGKLFSLWSTQWGAVLADGGVGPAVSGLLDADAGRRFEAFESPEALDSIAVLDETTFQPTALVALPQPIAASGQPNAFAVTIDDGGVTTFTVDQTLLSATDGKALIVRIGGNQANEQGVLVQLIDVSTGLPTLERGIVFAPNDPAADAFRWETQEDSIQHYALQKRGTQYVLTYLASTGWMELELSAGQPELRSTTFARDCDTENLALSPDLSTAYFHSEGGCFGFDYSELLLRCRTLLSDNLDGGVNDLGTTGNRGGKR